MSKYVWIVAGGIMQVPLIKEVKSRGYKVFCTDGNSRCPGTNLSDQFVCLDTYDVYGHIDLAASMSDKPIAVLTAGADVGPTVSAIAEELGLKAVDYEVAKHVRNKGTMRDLLNQRNPAYKVIPFTDDTPHSIWASYCRFRGIDPYPCVVKPLEKAGSKGVILVESPWGLPEAARKAKIADSGMNRHYIVEKRLYGPEIATDNFVIDGKIKFASAVYRKFSKKVFGLEVAHVTYDPPKEVRDLIKYAASALGVDWGPFKVDFIYDREYGWVITECATRLSGGFDHMYAAPLATGKDITGFMLDMALGEELNMRKLWNTEKKFACVYSPVFPSGVDVKTINVPEDKHIKHLFRVKDITPVIENCADRSMFYITVGNTACEAYKQAKIVEKEILL